MSTKRTPRGFLWLGILSWITASAVFLYQDSLESAIKGTGVTAPEGLILLAPILGFIGSLVLMLIKDEVDPEEENSAWTLAVTQIPNDPQIDSRATTFSKQTDRMRLILSRFEGSLKRARDFLGFGNLTVGFALKALSLNSKWLIGVVWCAVGLVAAGLLFAAIYWRLWPCYRTLSWAWAVDCAGSQVSWWQHLRRRKELLGDCLISGRQISPQTPEEKTPSAE